MDRDVVSFITSNRDILDLIIDMVPIPLFVKDRAGRYIACNVAFKNFLGVSREQIIGRTVHEMWSKEEADVFFAQDLDLLTRGGLQIYETQVTSSDSVRHVVQFHKQAFTDADGKVMGFLGAIFDITEKRKLERALADLAATDELTRLPNRREGMAQLEFLHTDSVRKKRPYSVAVIDVDHFKKLNDHYGHACGDIVLQAFADLAKRALRGRDVCFRYGGEEFVILLPETTLAEGHRVVERLRRDWAESDLTLPGGQAVKVTFSVGLAQFSMDGDTYDAVLKAADMALYDAKNSGRNRTVCAPSREV